MCGNFDDGHDAEQSRPLTGGEARMNPRHTSPETPGPQPRWRFGNWKSWAVEHKGEILWAFVFAIIFAWPAARFIEPPKHDPYRVAVVEYSHTDDDTQKMFNNLSLDWSKQPPMVGDVPVNLEVRRLVDDTPNAAKRAAQDLLGSLDMLMVIGHLPSGLTEVSIPMYMEAHPPMPYISTTASDDDLLVRCEGKCSDSDGFVPLIQPSPRNSDQGDSAVRFAIQNGKKRFLIVTEVDQDNKTYLDNMVEGFEHAINNSGRATVVGTHSIGAPPSDQQIRDWSPDCILYAGRAGAAETLLHSIHGKELMVILSDSVIETRVNDEKLMVLSPVRFTYPTDAADYNRHVSVYGKDAVSISRQLIEDLNKNGGDFRYQLRSLVHLENIQDARRSLVEVMKKNAASRTWYYCESSSACVFDHHRRINGMFHVWRLDENNKTEMLDIDGWHPPRTVPKN
jgi:hypothetical protein